MGGGVERCGHKHQLWGLGPAGQNCTLHVSMGGWGEGDGKEDFREHHKGLTCSAVDLGLSQVSKILDNSLWEFRENFWWVCSSRETFNSMRHWIRTGRPAGWREKESKG